MKVSLRCMAQPRILFGLAFKAQTTNKNPDKNRMGMIIMSIQHVKRRVFINDVVMQLSPRCHEWDAGHSVIRDALKMMMNE